MSSSLATGATPQKYFGEVCPPLDDAKITVKKGKENAELVIVSADCRLWQLFIFYVGPRQEGGERHEDKEKKRRRRSFLSVSISRDKSKS